MNRKVYLIILVILLSVAAYFYFSRQTSTIETEFSHFAIKDTASVSRIFIADPDGSTAELNRQKDNTWTINNKYPARKDGVNLLLEAFKGIMVTEMVPKSAIENVIRSMAANSIKVEIYTGGDQPVKIYYIGDATKNHQGTYMLLEIDGKKSSIPYIMSVEGFHGFLQPRFFTEEYSWRKRNIFPVSPENIQTVKVAYYERPLKSFLLEKSGHEYKVSDLNSMLPVEPLKMESIEEYMGRFRTINYEYFADQDSSANLDSVKKSQPIHLIEVQDIKGNTIQMKTYYKPVKGSMIINEATGEFYTYDLDRLYGCINEEDFVVLQWQMLDKILAYNDDFRKPENVDN